MRINRIELKGWKSFNEQGVVLDNLKQFNLVIGPNNAGKSNLYKFFYYLRAMYHEGMNDSWDIKKNYGHYTHIEKTFRTEDSWNWKQKDIECYINLNPSHSEKSILSEKTKDLTELKLLCKGSLEKNQTMMGLCLDDGSYLLEPGSNSPKVYSEPFYDDMTDEKKEAFDTYKICNKFLNSLIFIDPIRHYEREGGKKECDYNGASIIGDLLEINKNDRPRWQTIKKQIDDYLESILHEDIALTVSGNNTIEFELQKEDTKISATLSELGTGVAQLFIILSILILRERDGLIFFIEEPECNLHPNALIRLIKLLESNFKNNSYFISTHSSSLLDIATDEWSIHRIIKNKIASYIQNCNSISQKYQILDDLGITASQLLLSNFIIWVEGPSDRIYLNKWIEIFTDGFLKEHEHYSFLMYGGTNLTHYNLLDPANIDILSTSRYSFVICDSDKKSDGCELKDRVKNLVAKKKEIEEVNPGFSKFFVIWVTEGREIENYISGQCLSKVLFSDKLKKKYFQPTGEDKRVLTFNEVDDSKYSKFDSYDVYFSKFYSHNDTVLSDSEYNNIANHYSSLKVEIAYDVVQKLDHSSLDIYDLKDNIQLLVKKIKNANQIE